MSDRSDERGDWLWDRSGAPDADGAELERLLQRYRHGGAARARRGGAWRRPFVLAAAVAVIAVGAVIWAASRPDRGDPHAPALVAGGVRLAEDEWFTATEQQNRLALGAIGDLTLAPGSRLQVRRVGAEQTRLYLEKGHLHAFVDASVRPRFFQVDTPSARCVDLGCMYDLRVDEAGDAHVAVSLGQIAFELDDRDVYVPRGAECLAKRDRGLGTPRFSDCDPAIAKLVDAFDAEHDAQRRADYADKLAWNIELPRDTLTLWHLLRDRDPAIAALAERRLVEIAGHPLAAKGETVKGWEPVDAATWRAHLESLWW